MKKPFLKILAGILMLSCLLIGAGVVYLQKALLPKRLKPMLEENVLKYTGFKINIDSVALNITGSILLKNLTLFEKKLPGQKFLTVNQVTVHFRPFEILLKKQLLIDKVALKTLKIYPGTGRSFTSTGDLFLDGEFSYKFSKPQNLSYKGVLTFKDQDIKNMPLVKDVSKLNGQIRIEQDKISITKLKGLSFGCPVEFAGFLGNFNDPYMELTEIIDLDLSRINNFLPKKVNESIKQITLSGKSAVTLGMSGKFSQWPLKFNGQANILNAQASLKPLSNPLNDINGSVFFDENSLTIQELKIKYNRQDYALKASVVNFTAPSIHAILVSQNLFIETKIKTEQDYLRFDSIEGSWFNSSLNLVGELQSYENPRLKLSGQTKINLEDLQKIAQCLLGENQKISNIINNFNPKGVCAASIYFDGLVKNFKNCELGIKLSSENISLSGFNMGGLDMTAQLKDRSLAIPKLNLTPYRGALNMRGEINFAPLEGKTPAPSYTLIINASDIDLGQLIKDTALKDKDIWAAITLAASLKGNGYDLSNLTGLGNFKALNGHLWEFPLLGGIASTFGLPMLTKLEIKEAACDFTIADKKITTQNLLFTGPQINMLSAGSLGFGGELDFNIGLNFSQSFANENQFAKLASAIVDQTGRLIAEVTVGGTVNDPKYGLAPFHIDKIFKTKFMKGIKKIFTTQ